MQSHWRLSVIMPNAEQHLPIRVSPMHGASFDIGFKYVIGYFLVHEGNCDFTVWLTDALLEDQEVPMTTPVRFYDFDRAREGRSRQFLRGRSRRVRLRKRHQLYDQSHLYGSCLQPPIAAVKRKQVLAAADKKFAR